MWSRKLIFIDQKVQVSELVLDTVVYNDKGVKLIRKHRKSDWNVHTFLRCYGSIFSSILVIT